MQLKKITSIIEEQYPLAIQENYDNSGLIVGREDLLINAILICVDCNEKIIDEAIAKGCNLIVSHHPPVFSGIKKFNGRNETERIIEKAIKNEIAIYSVHTNMDNSRYGVNKGLCDMLGIENPHILNPVSEKLRKLVVYTPKDHADKVRDALFGAGAGSIGNYDHCSFGSEGFGSYRPGEGTTPFLGKHGEFCIEAETRIETIYSEWQESSVLNALRLAHPYEEIAYDIIPLKNSNFYEGSGMIGSLKNEMKVDEFLDLVKEKLNCKILRFNKCEKDTVREIAVCGGSGSFLLPKAIQQKADAFITGDIKYHQFQEPAGRLLYIDAGHYETEQHTKIMINDLILKKIPNFAVYISKLEENPVCYK